MGYSDAVLSGLGTPLWGHLMSNPHKQNWFVHLSCFQTSEGKVPFPPHTHRDNLHWGRVLCACRKVHNRSPLV